MGVASSNHSAGRRSGAALLIGPALILGVVVGCGDKGRLEVAPVRGQVTYQGRGVPSATVIFHPSEGTDESAKKLRPFAYADANGNFVLKTYIDGDGAPPGTYRVSIVARSSPPGGIRSKDSAPSAESSSAPGIRIPPKISEKYANVETAGIQVTIHEGENILEPFAL